MQLIASHLLQNVCSASQNKCCITVATHNRKSHKNVGVSYSRRSISIGWCSTLWPSWIWSSCRPLSMASVWLTTHWTLPLPSVCPEICPTATASRAERLPAAHWLYCRGWWVMKVRPLDFHSRETTSGWESTGTCSRHWLRNLLAAELQYFHDTSMRRKINDSLLHNFPQLYTVNTS